MIIYANRIDDLVPVLVDDDFPHEGDVSIASHGYVQMTEPGAGRSILLHRWVLGLRRGDGLIADHINGDPLDNRRCNLRAVDGSISNANRAIARGRYSATYRAPSGRWQGHFRWRRVRHHVGTFDTRDEAAAAVLAYRRKHCPDSIMEGA